MRPLKKWDVGYITTDGTTIASEYEPHTQANELLHQNLDKYCNYCEVFSSDLEVEHIVSQSQNKQLRTHWANFLLACGRCNGTDNKGSKSVNLSNMYFPHQNNTLLVFDYLEGGIVKLNTTHLTQQHQIDKANSLLNLVCLDKYPSNPKYPQGFPIADRRWEIRRRQWETAQMKLNDYENNMLTAPKILEFARQRGFFSIWFTVFKHHREVREVLANGFRGTDPTCFDVDFLPIPRNMNNPNDPI